MENNKIDKLKNDNTKNKKNSTKNIRKYIKCLKTDRPNLTVGKLYKILRIKNSTHDIRIMDDNQQGLWISPGISRKEQFSLELK